MMLIEQTTVPPEALPLERFKAHLRLGTGFTDDDAQDSLLRAFLSAAIAAIEARTAKALLLRSFTWTLSAWRDGAREPLPVAPVRAITALRLGDRNGTTCVCDPASYRLERDTHVPRLASVGLTLPTIPTGGTAEVDFDAGFGADWNGLPADLGQAVFLLAAHYHENRHEAGFGDGQMPFGVLALIERWRRLRLGTGGVA
ncbi:phage conserved hypothetical protein, phiE125 gp8 family [Rhodovulum sp. ES.010]|uniref:head-tail connector protein n=1 Tax=Rhodovulum sp. ES.010 TaxID=1882821 RepID=UPI000925E8E1|nr:hypothetical protein [Rhodovulum sp. ES.010]SIO10851.1 phage conserved hypothetical protein, phiE125 gp8 family [Rhodovulum sp. ES.010]